MIRISGVDGVSRVLRGNTLWIKTGCSLSEQAPSGSACFDPATSSPCEAWFGSESRSQESGGGGGDGGRDLTAECRTEKCRMSKGGGRPEACVLSIMGGVIIRLFEHFRGEALQAVVDFVFTMAHLC